MVGVQDGTISHSALASDPMIEDTDGEASPSTQEVVAEGNPGAIVAVGEVLGPRGPAEGKRKSFLSVCP